MIILSIAFVFLFQIAISNGFFVQPKIINGISSNPVNYPFYVSIGRDGATFGGTLLSDRYLLCLLSFLWAKTMIFVGILMKFILHSRWVITAAHGLIWEDELIAVYLGISMYGSFSEKMQVDKSNRFLYPEYSAYRKANDIGSFI